MNKLPEKFPEYSLMYKILGRKIQDLELKMESVHPDKIKDVQKSIKNFETERKKIKEMFPENFFENLESG
ncbi:MAG: hypothetical protein OEM18_02455 [Nitrosopumilus sp.]|jgi:hypothetical protein|nr:hypothetical protein [Nitrosopumilus sp.]MDH3502221.1 hypothetical protein [Nitrosopumilus sp.]